jgi:DNA-binding NarL/FixJ family response regulator/multidrug resistance efflux pump
MIKIFLIESQRIVREGLKVLLNAESDFQVFASDNKDVKISLINQLKPDIILIGLDNLDEADFDYLNIFSVRNKHPYQLEYLEYSNQPRIIIFAGKVDELILNKALNWGCDGYLLKESPIEELKQAIRSVYNGYKHIGNSVFNLIKQFSVTDKSSVKALEKTLVNSQENYRIGLITTSSDRLSFEHINNREIIIPKSEESPTIVPEVDYPTMYSMDRSESKKRDWLRSIGSSLILISLGCAAGILGVLSIRDRAAKSFSPIDEYGIVYGEILPIRTPYLGTIKQLGYKVGDVIEAGAIITKLEPQYNRQQEQIIAEISKQIEIIEQQIEQEKQLLAVTQSHLNSNKHKRQQSSSISLEQDDSNIVSGSLLKDVQEKVRLAFANYQRLQKLEQQKAVSQQEAAHAKQAWMTAQNELIQLQNDRRKNLPEFPNQEAKLQSKNKQNLEDLRNNINIEIWTTQAKEREKIINLLAKNLGDAKKHLLKVTNSYQEQRLINIKAPLTGVVYQINKNTDQLLDKDRTIIELLNCNNLWVEIIVDGNLLKKINLQQLTRLNFGNRHKDLIAKISSVQPLQNFGSDYSKHSLKNLADRTSLFKIVINFSISDNYARGHKFCGVGKNAIVTFNNQ